MKSVKDMLFPRYRVSDEGYPEMPYEEGAILCLEPLASTEREGVFIYSKRDLEEDFFKRYPSIFKPLKWWQHQSADNLLSVEFAKVVEYVGYWVVGDVVPVTNYEIEDRKIVGYILGSDHFHLLNKVIPATKEDYDE